VKYVLMFAETEQFAADWAAMDESERERAYGRVGQWFAEHADQIVHHTHLMPIDTATTVLLGGAEPVITDGPYVEGKEVISGFAEVEVPDLDAALKLARDWPGCPLVEIRPLASP
jgi:hypothetical protein